MSAWRKARLYLLLFLVLERDFVAAHQRELLSGPEFVETPPSVVTFTNTSGTKVSCVAKGDPPPQVTWWHLDRSPVSDIPGVREIMANGSLVIRPFSGAAYRQDVHAGIYQCRITNPTGTVLAPPTTFRAVVVQELEVRVYDEYVIQGNTGVLRCVLPAFLKDLVTVMSWVRDDSFHIYPSERGDGKYHAVQDGLLLVHDVETADSYATYRCRVVHKLTGATATSNTARIIVHDPREKVAPRIVTEAGTFTASDNTALVVPCVAHSHPPPTYKWWTFQDGEKVPLHFISNKAGAEGRPWLSAKSVLVFPAAVARGSSLRTFVCEAKNEAGEATVEIRVESRSPVIVQVAPKVLVVDAGTVGTFKCQTQNIAPLGFTWYKDGQVLTPAGRFILNDGGRTLQVRGVTRSDTGMYQCFVRRGQELTQAAAELRLGASPPELVYKFISQTLTPGPTVSLKCIAKGAPTPTISWTLDGFRLSENERILVGQYVSGHSSSQVVSHVNITRVRVNDGGEYGCTATNAAASVTHSAPLNVYGLRTLPATRRQQVTSSGELIIRHVTREADEGEYTCTASNKQGAASAQVLILSVVEPPRVAPFSLPRALEAGSRVAVQCVVNGDPPVKLTWLHNNNAATQTPGIAVTPLGQFVLALVIEKVEPLHAGNYTCRAASPASVAAHSAALRVHVPPVIRSFDFGEVVAVGMRTQVTCLIQVGDPPISLHWLRNGVALEPDVQIRQHDQFSSTLLLSPVRQAHAANYTCLARNPAGEARHTAELRVRVPPRWQREPEDVNVIRGEDAMLVCAASGYPPPNITWRKTSEGNHDSVNHESSLRSFGHDTAIVGARIWDNGTLVIARAPEAAEGDYLCEAFNGVGSGISAIIALQVHAPPVVTAESPIREVRKGDMVTIAFLVKGDPPLSISIARNGHQLEQEDNRFRIEVREYSNRKTSEEEEKRVEIALTSAVTAKDSADFTCSASNPYGTHLETTKLLVQDAPDAPRDLRVAQESSRSATLTWTVPSSPNTPISHYILHIKPRESTWKGAAARQIKIEGPSTSAHLSDLTPSKVYEVRVVAINSVGESPSSEPLTLRTDEEAPDAPPKDVRAVGISPTEVRLSWSPPEKHSWNGQLRGYHVGYKKNGDSESFEFETASTTAPDQPQMWVVSNLNKFTHYSFVVQAFNDRGTGPPSQAVSAATQEDVPEASPEGVACVPLTSTRIEISWSPPPRTLTHGNVVGYTVTYLPLDDHTGLPAAENKIVQSTETTLGELEKFTNYSVTVAAATKAGLGVFSEPVTCATEEDVPEAPAAAKAVVAGLTSIIVAWAPPRRTFGLLTKYTLYTRVLPDRDYTKRILHSQTEWMELTDLVPGRPSEFWLTASTKIGEGPSSARVTAYPSATVGAAIYAVGGAVRVAHGTDVVLSCPFIGSPKPVVSWQKNSVPLSFSSVEIRIEKQLDGSLLIRDSQRLDSGNYSCHVENQHGSDSIEYSVLIMVRPSAVLLHALGSTSDSVSVSWRSGDSGGAPIRKLVLTWRPDRGEWTELVLPRHLNKYTLGGLACGRTHHVYLTPHNFIGAGQASGVVTISTKGSKPPIPLQPRILTTNATAVALHLFAFHDQQCQTTQFSIGLKQKGESRWMTVEERLGGEKREYVISDLIPGAYYDIKITAQNPAGESLATYSFRTLTYGPGERLQEGIVSGSNRTRKGLSSQVFADPAFLIPAIVSVLALIAIIVSVVLCLKKRTSEPATEGRSARRSSNGTHLTVDGKNIINPEQYYTVKKPPPPSPQNGIDLSDRIPEYAEDIYPYATFQIQRQEGSLPNHFQTFICQNSHRSADGGGSQYVQDSERVDRQVAVPGHEPCQTFPTYDSEDDEENYNSDSDTDHAASSRTESSSHLEDGMTLSRVSSGGRNAHHNLLYVTSDTSTVASPNADRKSLPRRGHHIKANGVVTKCIRRSAAINNGSPVGATRLPNGGIEGSDAECDRELGRRRSRKAIVSNNFSIAV